MDANQRELTNAVEAKAVPPSPSVVKKIVVAVSLSAHSEATVRYAAKWAQLFGAPIDLVHVCPLESGDGFGISQEVIDGARIITAGICAGGVERAGERHPGILPGLPNDSLGRRPG